MALKHLTALLVVVISGSACGRTAPDPAEPEEPEALSVTRWTGRTELFAEYPPLVVGETSRFAIHLTRLETFAPLLEGRVEVHLRGGPDAAAVFAADGPSRPGIFGVDVTPTRAGTFDLVIVIHAAGLDDEHQVGRVDVHATADAARTAPGDTGDSTPGITFLKEQQWSLDFGTAVVTAQSLRESIRVPGRIAARPGGVADVAAPIDGRLTRVADASTGVAVSRGQELARLLPPPTLPAERPAIDREVADARASMTLATRERERAERLTAAGAVPARRLDDARTAEEQARARLAAAEASLAQYTSAQGGTAGVDNGFIVRSPIDGVIARRDAVPGASVTAGTLLFRVVDDRQVHVVGDIPEMAAPAAARAEAAEIVLSARADRQPAGRLVGVGRMFDPATRTLPITFAFDNRQAAMPVGQPVFLDLLTGSTASGPVVPASALVDDAGRPIVFVQREGETFERRAVTVGASSGGFVQITEGVRPGERIVTRGAYLVRLAALSTTVPAHGHVH